MYIVYIYVYTFILMMNNAVVMYVCKILYVQEVVTLQKKIFNIFASENEVYTIF